jgi:hypothetical protein
MFIFNKRNQTISIIYNEEQTNKHSNIIGIYNVEIKTKDISNMLTITITVSLSVVLNIIYLPSYNYKYSKSHKSP